jgi:hypothetical protein
MGGEFEFLEKFFELWILMMERENEFEFLLLYFTRSIISIRKFLLT